MNLYDRIMQLCDKTGISITSLCLKITGSKGNLPTWQKGNFRVDQLIKIADYFNVSIDDLLDYSPTFDINNVECKEHAIAYIDLLGSTNRLRADEQSFTKDVAVVYNAIETTLKNMNKDNNLPNNKIKYKVFSDNIIIAIECNESDKVTIFGYLFNIVAMFQFTLAAHGYAIRGSICRGNLFFNNSFVFGNGLVDAYKLESENAFYQRIIISQDVANELFDEKGFQNLIRFDFDLFPYLNYLVYATNESELELHRRFLLYQNQTQDIKVKQKNSWAIHYHNCFCEEHGYKCLISKNNLQVTISNKAKDEDLIINAYRNASPELQEAVKRILLPNINESAQIGYKLAAKDGEDEFLSEDDTDGIST